ncbi:winged helix-turn-helix transcriptional regulator [Brevibacillus centrosporus]|jgi:DNA-binding HxlR family transcriptional regulator
MGQQDARKDNQTLTEKGSNFQAALKEMEKWGQKWGSNRHE